MEGPKMGNGGALSTKSGISSSDQLPKLGRQGIWTPIVSRIEMVQLSAKWVVLCFGANCFQL